MTMTYAFVVEAPVPGNKLDAVFALDTGKHDVIEIRQHLVAVLQTVGFQKGRRFLSPSGPTKRRPSLCDSFLRKIPLPAGKIAAEKGRWLNASA